MEDSGGIAQWSSIKKQPTHMEDTLASKVSVPSVSSSTMMISPSSNITNNTNNTNINILKGGGNIKRNSRGSKTSRTGSNSSRLPPINSSKRPSQRSASNSSNISMSRNSNNNNNKNKKRSSSATGRAASRPNSASSHKKSLNATGSRASTPGGNKNNKNKNNNNNNNNKSKKTKSPASRGSSRASSARKSIKRQTSAKGRKGSPGNKTTIKGSKTTIKGKGKGKGNKKRPVSPHGSGKEEAAIAAAISALSLEETRARDIIITEEETIREEMMPEYNLLAMNMVQSQIIQVNQRQKYLNDTFKALQAHGVHLSSGQDPNSAVETLRAQFQAEVQKQADDLRIENATLRNIIDEKKAEIEQKVAEEQNLRDKINRKLMRFEVENESLKAEVQSALQTTQLDVERMKRELGHRLDIATAALRTPKYETALRSMQDLVRSVQEEIQEHHDVLSKLIVSISAQDTFLRDKSDSMHTNLPIRYRDELRKLDKDHLLNLLDVLSFHDPVVETVGKALYVLQKTEHGTNVF